MQASSSSGLQSAVSRKGLLFCLVGPAGGGKTSIYDRLLGEFSDSLNRSVSVTSRQPRPAEREGESYYFVSREEFQARIDSKRFFEWEETHGFLYGTLQETLDSTITNGQDLLLEVDIRGALRFKASFPQTTVITFIVPPSIAILRKRIVDRAPITEDELSRRMSTAVQEYSLFIERLAEPGLFDYLIVNQDLDRAYSETRAQLIAERQRICRLDVESVRSICTI